MITIAVHLFEPVRPSKSGSIGKFIPASPLANDIENEIDNDNDSHVELASAGPVEWRFCRAMAGEQRAALRFSPSFLKELSYRMIEENLGAETRGMIHEYSKQLEFAWSSACSGSDSPAWAINGLVDHLRGQDIACEAQHEVSAELDARKREFIMSVHSPKQLYADMFDICHRAKNLMTDEYEDADPRRSSSIWYIGFSCKSVSTHNRSRTPFAIRDSSSTTGKTYDGVLRIVRMQRPPAVCLENVPGLMENSQHLIVIEDLANLGYITYWTCLNAQTFGLPQPRNRIYFLSWRKDILDECCLTPPGLRQFCDEIMQRLQHDHPLMDITDFLVPEDDSIMLEERAAMLQRVAERSCAAQSWPKPRRWVDEHAQVATVRHSRSRSPTWSFPEYPATEERERSFLRVNNVKIPETSRRIIDLSQSKMTVSSEGCSPTITPKGIFYVAWLVRLLRGYEAMALQGMFLTEETKLRFSDKPILQDLAGNAFATPCVLSITILHMAVMGLRHRRLEEIAAQNADAGAAQNTDAGAATARGTRELLGLPSDTESEIDFVSVLGRQ